MPKKKKKIEFDWKKGEHLSPNLYDPLGNVRDTGFTKLADAIYADPALRKEERKKKLVRPYKPKVKEFFIEEAESGLHEEITPSDSSRLIRKDQVGFKGILRFKKPAVKKGKKKRPRKSKPKK